MKKQLEKLDCFIGYSHLLPGCFGLNVSHGNMHTPAQSVKVCACSWRRDLEWNFFVCVQVMSCLCLLVVQRPAVCVCDVIKLSHLEVIETKYIASLQVTK